MVASLNVMSALMIFLRSAGLGNFLFKSRIFRKRREFRPAILNLVRKLFKIDSAISWRSSCVYLLKSTIKSKRRERALSKCLNRFVVAMTVICSFRLSNPLRMADVARPISRRSWELVLSRAIASISEQCGDVLLCLAELAVDDGVEIDAEQVALQNAGDLPYGFGLARSGCALKQELVDSHVPLDGVDDSDNVLLNGRGERQRIVRRGDLAEKSHLVFVHLRHKCVRAGHKGHDVFRKLIIAAGVKIPGNFVCLLTECGIVFFGVIANQINDILLFHGLDLPYSLI